MRAARDLHGGWPATIGSVSTSTCWPSTASCSIAAGRRVSSEAMQDLAAALPVGQALGDLGGGGGLARTLQADHQDRHRRDRVEIDRFGCRRPSISTSWSWTILTTMLAGRDRLDRPRRRRRGVRTLSVKERATTSRATSASSRARRTSRSAASTSSSVSAPRRVRRSRRRRAVPTASSNIASRLLRLAIAGFEPEIHHLARRWMPG